MENLRQRTSVTDYANHFSGLLLEIPHMHPADAMFVKGQASVLELQRPPTDDAMHLAQQCTRPAYLTTGQHLHLQGPQATGCSDQAAIMAS